MKFRMILSVLVICWSVLCLSGCGLTEGSTLDKCKRLESSWRQQTNLKREVLRSLGVHPGMEQTVLYRMNQHKVVHKEHYEIACMHVITEFKHED